MRLHLLFATAAVAAAFALPVSAADTAQQSAMKSCAASWSAMSAADKAKTKHQDYMSSCLKGGGKTAASSSSSMSSSMSMSAKPAAAGSMAAAAPGGGGSAKCKDGTTVTYKHRQGTCSGHGGVATWM
ncbi:MAG TPA: hypothetical protein VH189_02580 [Rhizomicrobium sp.]|nr:hypothetical protein [Rhizomicrobium sp.]